MADAKILIVEDEGIEALDIRYRLTSLGYPDPVIAYSGEEAIEQVEKACPDLVLMDIMLQGGIDGVSTAQQIHARFDVPVVYLTAYADDDTLRRAKITEPFGYIVKPFKERELRVTIDVALYKHRMERKLRESEKWLATTLKSIGDAVVATDKDGLITFMNPVAESLMGWKLEEVHNKLLTGIFNIINRDTRKPVENPVEKVILEGVTVGLANHTILVARDGTEIPIDDSAAPIKDDNGNIIGVVLVFRDVTEREKALREICRYRDELELRVEERTVELARANEVLQARAQQLEVLNRELKDFAFVASHDLQEPLRKITSFGDRLKKNLMNSIEETNQDYLDRMIKSAGRMSKLINALLNYSQMVTKANPFEKIDLSQVARSAVNNLELAIEKIGARLEIGDLPSIDADFMQISQLFQNIIANSIKYSKENEKPVISIRSQIDEQTCRIFFQDNGIGFEEIYLDRIFKPFQRLHLRSAREGTGMGLAICKKIVDHHGGTITAKSTPGNGATFIVSLPIRQEAQS